MDMRNYKNWGMKDWFSTETALLVRGSNSLPAEAPACGRMLFPSWSSTDSMMATSGSLEQRAHLSVLDSIILWMMLPCWNANKQQIGYSVFIFSCLFSVVSIELVVIEHGWNKALSQCCQHSSRGRLGMRWYLCCLFLSQQNVLDHRGI